MNMIDFVRESNRIEGILREPTEAEVRAHRAFLTVDELTVYDLINLVKVLQPNAELRDRFSVPGVRVGGHIAPPSGPDIRGNLENILHRAKNVWYNKIMPFTDEMGDNEWAIHCDYECLHPFTDGNGRSGRALWLWCKGGLAPLGFLHEFYYQTLSSYRK